jgi:hypothetical protein
MTMISYRAAKKSQRWGASLRRIRQQRRDSRQAQARFERALMAAVERLAATNEQRRRLLGSKAGPGSASACSVQYCGVGTSRRSCLYGGTNWRFFTGIFGEIAAKRRLRQQPCRRF